jgi:hypothetical protein
LLLADNPQPKPKALYNTCTKVENMNPKVSETRLWATLASISPHPLEGEINISNSDVGALLFVNTRIFHCKLTPMHHKTNSLLNNYMKMLGSTIT